MREKLIIENFHFILHGITPACAGKTLVPKLMHVDEWDHPRVCGKNAALRIRPNVLAGSPPRVREKRQIVTFNLPNAGITPACAGKTVCQHFWLKNIWDHPRVCGKNALNTINDVGTFGSPPRVREKRWSRPRFQSWYGITPACAGKTKRRQIYFLSLWDHPRVCGKNSISA